MPKPPLTDQADDLEVSDAYRPAGDWRGLLAADWTDSLRWGLNFMTARTIPAIAWHDQQTPLLCRYTITDLRDRLLQSFGRDRAHRARAEIYGGRASPFGKQLRWCAFSLPSDVTSLVVLAPCLFAHRRHAIWP